MRIKVGDRVLLKTPEQMVESGVLNYLSINMMQYSFLGKEYIVESLSVNGEAFYTKDDYLFFNEWIQEVLK